MDCLSSTTAKSDLERMLFDETEQPKALPLSLLAEITNGFSDKQIIGQGGFAVVYQGMLNGGKVAVKRLSNTLMHEEFQREVVCLMMVKHRNVVRFLGYCADMQGSMERYNGKYVMADVQQRLLCFEYLPKGSLDKYITDTSRKLQWRNCYQIIKGICQGLHYLHEKNIVHLDLKPANILLDDNFVPKIADFGLSRCFDEAQSRVFTVNIRGTLGYLAPEFLNGEITYQFDLYSLGVIIIEILTGKKGYHDVDTVVESWSNKLEQSQSDIQLKQVRVCTEIGIECTDFNPAKRPGTKNIIDRLDDTEDVHGYIETSVITSQLEENAPNELHQDRPKAPGETSSVGKLKLLEELKVFQVNKKSDWEQLEHLTKLRELGIYNLEKIHTEEEAAQAKLIEKKYLRRLTLDWDRKRSSVEPGVEATVLESLQPHGDLQVLCIRGHGGPSCPTWLGDEFAVEALQSLYLAGVSWEVFPSLGKARDLRELRFEDIARLKEFIIERSFCMLIKLELIGLGSFEKWVFPAEQESSQQLPMDAHVFPLLQVLIIRECPKFLEFPVSNHILYPDWFPELQELEIQDCPEFLSPISWTESLFSVKLANVKLLRGFAYSKSPFDVILKIEGKGDLHNLDQVLVFSKETGIENLTLDSCPPLQLKHLLVLTSLKTLFLSNSYGLVGPLEGHGDEEWQLPVEHMRIWHSYGDSGKELTELLPHLPKLSILEIRDCRNIKKLVVGVDVQQTTQEPSEMGGGEITAAAEEEDAGVLQFPAHLCDSLLELEFDYCKELVLVDPPTLVPGGGGLQALRSLQRLDIWNCPKFLSAFSFSRHLFPSSLQFLELTRVEGMGTLEPLSNLSSLVTLKLQGCGEDLKCQGLWSLLTTGGQLNELEVTGSPRFFADWDPNPRRALEVAEGGEEQQTQLVSSTLRELWTDDAAGLLAAPVCRFLSSSLTKLTLLGNWCEGMERFIKEQEDALQLLSSLQQLEFWYFKDLQQLPAGLRNLTSLKILSVNWCPAISSLPNDALSDSLQELYVGYNCSEELKQYCRGEGTIPKIIIY